MYPGVTKALGFRFTDRPVEEDKSVLPVEEDKPVLPVEEDKPALRSLVSMQSEQDLVISQEKLATFIFARKVYGQFPIALQLAQLLAVYAPSVQCPSFLNSLFDIWSIFFLNIPGNLGSHRGNARGGSST
jgi:hypothetical protein